MSHSHHHDVTASNPRLGLSIALTLAFVAGEAVAGYVAHSLALMSDAGHNFSDALALMLSWYGVQAAQRPATSRRTFGSHRVGILAALANALTLVAIGAIIIWEAVERFRDPQPVQGGPMIWVALLAMLMNGVISVWLRSGAKHDLNLRSAYLHMLGDAVSAFGVVVAGIIVAFTGSPLADPAVSLLIGGVIIWPPGVSSPNPSASCLRQCPKGLIWRPSNGRSKGFTAFSGFTTCTSGPSPREFTRRAVTSLSPSRASGAASRSSRPWPGCSRTTSRSGTRPFRSKCKGAMPMSCTAR